MQVQIDMEQEPPYLSEQYLTRAKNKEQWYVMDVSGERTVINPDSVAIIAFATVKEESRIKPVGLVRPM